MTNHDNDGDNDYNYDDYDVAVPRHVVTSSGDCHHASLWWGNVRENSDLVTWVVWLIFQSVNEGRLSCGLPCILTRLIS